MTMARVLVPETLDGLAADDPAAQRSRIDLLRLHRAMGTRTILASGLRALCPSPPASGVLRILELGAGDGRLMLGVARDLAVAWPHAELTMIDRLDLVQRETLASYAAIGWTARAEVIDVLDWCARPTPHVPRWDLITANLFLHHFEGPSLDLLLAAIAARTEHFFACEPWRAGLPLAGSHLVGALGANAVTRRDAVASVQAGFRDRELGALWPGPAGAWQCQDYRAGLFSHCFSARRVDRP